MGKNYHKIISQVLRSCRIELAQKSCKKFPKEHKNTQVKREKHSAHFYPCKKCENAAKQLKMNQETYDNFLTFFVRNLKRTGVQVARKWV